MPTAEEYRQYARECIVSASTAVSETERRAFMDMSRKWTHAAMQIEADNKPWSKTDDG
jgi:hypothetical protein